MLQCFFCEFLLAQLFLTIGNLQKRRYTTGLMCFWKPSINIFKDFLEKYLNAEERHLP
jgi:hypothetical protein